MPSWTEMLDRVAAVAFGTAEGTVSWRDPDEEHSSEGTADFWFERPENHRCVARLCVGGERYPVLARWPVGTRDPSRLRERSHHSEGGHIHLWETDEWDWALIVDQPLTAQELAAVIGSIPALDEG